MSVCSVIPPLTIIGIITCTKLCTSDRKNKWGGASTDMHVVQQHHINAWKVMVYMVKPKVGRTDWSVFIDDVTEAYKRKVASFVRAENARHVMMQVNTYTWSHQ